MSEKLDLKNILVKGSNDLEPDKVCELYNLFEYLKSLAFQKIIPISSIKIIYVNLLLKRTSIILILKIFFIEYNREFSLLH